jgi:DHA1 family bicyclomycin/chloramphenicol resistance-like MFS transporter
VAAENPGMESRVLPGLGFKQFVCLIAALMATNALAIDSMLPALGQIGAALGVAHANDRQWTITAYLLGFGLAQIFYGTLADRYGRKPVLVGCMLLYIGCSLLAAIANSFELLIIARVVQGIGAAGTRVLAAAIVRDRYEGRTMARVMSLSYIVFLLVPILAPSIGQAITLVFAWRAIFLFLALYGAVVMLWIILRLPETLHAADRAPLELRGIARAFKFSLSNRISVGYTLAMSLIIGGLFGFINSSQQIFADEFHRPALFPLVFALIAGFIAAASLTNARLVGRLGMRTLSHMALLAFIGIAILHLFVALAGRETILSFAILQAATMFCFGLMVGNFGAMAMQPMGHIAGTAAAVQGCISTAGGAAIGMLTGQSFNGTTVPLATGFLACGCGALAVVLLAEGGRLFHAQATQEEAVLF